MPDLFDPRRTPPKPSADVPADETSEALNDLSAVQIDPVLANAFAHTAEKPNLLLVRLAEEAVKLAARHTEDYGRNGEGNVSRSEVVGRTPDCQKVVAFVGIRLPTKLGLEE